MLFVGSVVARTWTVTKIGMGKAAARRSPVPRGEAEGCRSATAVVEGPYRYMHNPLYDQDFCLILGAALLTQSWALVLVAVLDLALLAFQLPLEERELKERFGIPYQRYCELCAPLRPEAQACTPARTLTPERVVAHYRARAGKVSGMIRSGMEDR